MCLFFQMCGSSTTKEYVHFLRSKRIIIVWWMFFSVNSPSFWEWEMLHVSLNVEVTYFKDGFTGILCLYLRCFTHQHHLKKVVGRCHLYRYRVTYFCFKTRWLAPGGPATSSYSLLMPTTHHGGWHGWATLKSPEKLVDFVPPKVHNNEMIWMAGVLGWEEMPNRKWLGNQGLPLEFEGHWYCNKPVGLFTLPEK